MSFVVAIEFHQIDLGAQIIGLCRWQAAVGETLAGKAKKLIGRVVLAELVATRTVSVEGH